MDRDDIIRMAGEAGFGRIQADYWHPYFERFAALVAKHEREACAATVERGMGDWRLGKKVAEAIRARGDA